MELISGGRRDGHTTQARVIITSPWRHHGEEGRVMDINFTRFLLKINSNFSSGT